ncbi:hypothetical protein [Streptomyces microflavus]|uniref:hypothetical protein n=1 Tax=Streptomyces microflavus TaxID=1919 RepID=UPI002E2F9A99|nr:hypothetical protein [Streptomyces microflavus]
MPIVHSDRISGTIYAITSSAELAGDMALAYLSAKTEGRNDSYGVFDHKDEAEKELYNKYGSYDTDRDRVYAITLDIHATEQ